jgi:hypothetical protein
VIVTSGHLEQREKMFLDPRNPFPLTIRLFSASLDAGTGPITSVEGYDAFVAVLGP